MPFANTTSTTRRQVLASSAMGSHTPITGITTTPSTEDARLLLSFHATSRISTDPPFALSKFVFITLRVNTYNQEAPFPLSPLDYSIADHPPDLEGASLLQGIKKSIETAHPGTSLPDMNEIDEDPPSLSRPNSPFPTFSMQNAGQAPSTSTAALKRRRRRVSTSPEPSSSESETAQKRKPRKRGRRRLSRSSEPSPTSALESEKRKHGRELSWVRDRSSSIDWPRFPKRTKFDIRTRPKSDIDVAKERESSATLQDESSSESMDQPIIRPFEFVTTPRRPSTFIDDSAWGMDLS